MIIAVISTAVSGYAQERRNASGSYELSLDLGAAVYQGCGVFCFGYSFSDRWSAEAGFSMDFSNPSPDTQSEEYIHKMEFAPHPATEKQEIFRSTIEIGLRFWESDTRCGTYAYGGCIADFHGQVATSLGAGYRIGIWKGLNTDLMYRKIINSSNNMSDNLCLRLGYVF